VRGDYPHEPLAWAGGDHHAGGQVLLGQVIGRFGSIFRFIKDDEKTRWEVGGGEPRKVPLDDCDLTESAAD
jgi:hypothetical protein